MFKSRIFFFVAITSLALFVYFTFFGSKSKKLTPEEINTIILDHFKDSKHAEIELKIARIFMRIADGETDYDHLFHLYDLADSCRDALVPDLERDDALFSERLIFSNRESLKRYLKYNAHFSGTVVSFSPNSLENCGVNPNE